MMYDPGKFKCCLVVTVLGYSLRQGIFIVCISTIVISAIALAISIASICSVKDQDIPHYTTRPVSAVVLLFALFCCGIATYQILISALLLWNTFKSNGSLFSCSLYFISHLSIISFYGCFFIASTVAYFCVREYYLGVLTILVGILYSGLFIYFCIVVNSYSYTIEQTIYY